MGDVVKRITRKNSNLQSQLPLTISAEHGLVAQTSFFNKIVASENLKNYFLLNKGEFAYNKSYSRGYAWGVVKRLDNYEMGLVSTLYILFKPVDIYSDFLVQYYASTKWNKDISKISTEGARNHGLLNISTIDFFNTKLQIPDNKLEQIKLGRMLGYFDELLTLLQHKQKQLEQLKKAMLQKMFPKKESQVPEIRFDGFRDVWKQRRLGDIADVRDGTHDSPKYVNGGYPLLTSKNVGNGYINYEDINHVSRKDFEQINKRSKVDVNDILMGMIGTIGNLALIREEPNFAIKNIALIKYTNTYDYKFLFQELQSNFIAKELLSSMDGGTQKFISLQKIRNLHIMFPARDEQVKIGKFLSYFDSFITFNQQKLDHLTQLKKYLLQKMFI